MPKEFTAEINDDFYNRLASRIQKRGDINVGLGRGESLARGREGDVFESSKVGAARAATTGELADLDADLAYKVAGFDREERMIGEGRTYDSGETQKDRDFRERMAEKNRRWEVDDADRDHRRDYQSSIANLPAMFTGSMLGGLTSHYTGKGKKKVDY